MNIYMCKDGMCTRFPNISMFTKVYYPYVQSISRDKSVA